MSADRAQEALAKIKAWADDALTKRGNLQRDTKDALEWRNALMNITNEAKAGLGDKRVIVKATWVTYHEVVVADDTPERPMDFDELPEQARDQIVFRPADAEMIDFSLTDRTGK